MDELTLDALEFARSHQRVGYSGYSTYVSKKDVVHYTWLIDVTILAEARGMTVPRMVETLEAMSFKVFTIDGVSYCLFNDSPNRREAYAILNGSKMAFPLKIPGREK